MNDLALPEHRSRTLVHDSAIDRWVAVMLLAAPTFAFVLGGYLLLQQRFGDASVVLISGAFTAALTVAFVLPCRYTLLDDALNIRCGILCYTVPYNEIERVEPSSSWLSGPALSLRRVRVVTRRRSYLLSPKDREAFIEQLRQRYQPDA